jgi:ADP-dependent NAD(P)H-hydrate dehydratase / NAD(P)H-hydrate epimerase
MIVVTAAQMQAIDRKTIEEIGIPGRVLMENAGRGATRCFLEQIYSAGPGRVGVLAGRGNNGGDGFVIARYLAQQDIDVKVFLLSTRDSVQGDAAANLHLLSALNVPVVEIADAPRFAAQQAHMRHFRYWIDALLGTGLNSEIHGYFKEVLHFINALERPVFAVDIPSGLNSDTGQICGAAIRAAATATFGHVKIGHLVQPGASCCGRVELIDIGIPRSISEMVDSGQHLITGSQVQAWLPRRGTESHKGSSGHALIVAGAPGKSGAAAMSATSAMRAGAGLVTLAIPQTLNAILESLVVEAMTLPLPDEGEGILSGAAFNAIRQAAEGKRCIALGPGMGTAPGTIDLVHRIVEQIQIPMVIDADGLNNLAGHMDLLSKRTAPTVLTPHPGEMARLTGRSVADIQADRIRAVRGLALECKLFVILKGARSLVCDPHGEVWINTTGNAGMASGGMGDVLTGVLTGLLAQGVDTFEAARIAVYLHGLAADLLAAEAPWGFLATEVMAALPMAIQCILDDPPPAPVSTPVL